MRVRTSALALLLAVLPALVFAYPGFGGGRGLFRVQNALVEKEAGLTVSFHGLARNAPFDAVDATSGWVADLIAPELSYAPIATKYVGLELFGSWGGMFQTPKTKGSKELGAMAHDLKAGGKLSIPVLPVLKLGGSASYNIIPREWDDSTWSYIDEYAIPWSVDDRLVWNGLATIYLQDLAPSLPNLLVNYGKVAGWTQYGAAVELQGKGFGIFCEGTSLQDSSSSGIMDTMGRLRVTPGVAIGSATGVMLKLGYSFAFGHEPNSRLKDKNEIILGFGLATPFGARKPAQYGQIVGVVTDAGTGAPIAATVAFPENPKMATMTADAVTGIFNAKKVPVGAVTVEVSADGYNKQAVPMAVEANKVVNYEFKLRPLKTYGTIAGTVVDAVTGMPMAASIAFPGSQLQPVTADAAAGAFKVDRVETGVYTVTANADQYIPATVTLSVEENKLATATFKLTPAATAVTVTGKVADKKTGDPLAATVTVLEAGNAVFNTDPATGLYKAQLMPGAYSMVVEAKDYLKQTAALVVEKGKPLVRDFGLVKEGMALTLKGIYFNTGKSTIKPESRPALEDAAKILKENPTIKVEIQGHTDSQGSDESNLTLSDKRAWAVVNYLVKNLGIDINRLTAKGYGESRPIADNETAEGRSLNRRVEFVITGQQ